MKLLSISLTIVQQRDKSSNPDIMYFRMSCKVYIPQQSQWKKLSRPPILQIPQESQWYCCFFVCQNTWGEHIACYNSKQGSCVLNSKTSKPQTRHRVNRYYWAVGTSHGQTFPRFTKRRRCQPHHQRICRLNRSIHPCEHHNFRTPVAHLAHDCKASISPA
jgi:hypothetical protein